jgi:hypothetical protein
MAGVAHSLSRGTGGVTGGLRSVASSGLVGLAGVGFAALLLRAAPGPSALTVAMVLAALVGVSAAIVAPRAVFAVGIFLLPVVSIKVLRGDLILPLVLIATLITARASLPKIPYPIAIGLVVYVSMNAISMLNAPSPARAVSFMVVTVFLYLAAVWLAGLLRHRRFAVTAIKAYIWSCLASAAIGAVAAHVHLPLSNLLLFGGTRARAFFLDPNDFGSYLVPAAAILLEEIARPRLLGWPMRRLVLALVVLLIGIVESFSRDAILNVAVVFLVVFGVYALRKDGIRGAIRTVTIGLFLIVAGFGFLAATGSLNYFSQRSKAQTYDTQRFSNQANALRQATHSFVGHGPGQAEVLLPLPTHSLWVRAFFEEGALGLIGTILVYGGTLIAAWQLAARDANLYGIGSAALLGSWLGLVVASTFVDTVHWRLPYLLAGFVWASAAPREPSATR